MERSQAPKILCLAPDSMFVSFLCPFFAYTLSVFFLFLSFILSLAFKGQLVPRLHIIDALAALIIPGGFFHRSLLLFSEHHALNTYVSSSAYVPFLRHYMHRYDLSFGQAGLPGSCAYALRSHLFG